MSATDYSHLLPPQARQQGLKLSVSDHPDDWYQGAHKYQAALVTPSGTLAAARDALYHPTASFMLPYQTTHGSPRPAHHGGGTWSLGDEAHLDPLTKDPMVRTSVDNALRTHMRTLQHDPARLREVPSYNEIDAALKPAPEPQPLVKPIEGGGQTTAPKTGHLKIVKAMNLGEWGNSHSQSKSITHHAAKLMGISGYDPIYDERYPETNASHEKIARHLLSQIAQGRSDEPLYHGFQNVKNINHKIGDVIDLPVTATSGSLKSSAGYGTRDYYEDRKMEHQVYKGDPTVYEFAVGSPMYGYNQWPESDWAPSPQGFGHKWSEALTAGKFRVAAIRNAVGPGWRRPNLKVVSLVPHAIFHPEKGWMPMRHPTNEPPVKNPPPYSIARAEPDALGTPLRKNMDEKKDQQKLAPPQWLGRPIVDNGHVQDLETRAAMNEFGHKMPRHQAEQAAHDSYVKEQRERAAAHHLAGMKAAMATGNHEDAKKHWALYDLHLKALGGQSIGPVPPEIEKRMMEENGQKPLYRFKAHKGDLYALHEPSKDQAPPDGQPIQKSEKSDAKKHKYEPTPGFTADKTPKGEYLPRCKHCNERPGHDNHYQDSKPIEKAEAKQCKWRLGERRCKRMVTTDYCHDHVDHWANKIKQKESAEAPMEKEELLTKPPVSEAQRRAMEAAAHGDSTIGIPKKVGEEFSNADPGGKLPEHKKVAKSEREETLESALELLKAIAELAKDKLK